LGELGINEKIIFERYLKDMIREDVDWIRLTQELEKWRAVTNTILQLRIP
jgi:hypothetical protein